MNGLYLQDIYDTMNRAAMRNENKEVVWNGDDAADGQSFVGYVLISTDETATSLKSKSLVAYPSHAALMNFTSSFQRWLTENGHTVVA